MHKYASLVLEQPEKCNKKSYSSEASRRNKMGY